MPYPQAARTRGSITANLARQRAAAARHLDQAAAALANGQLSATAREVLTARVEHPDESYAQLADRLGMTKATYQTRLRAALQAHLRSTAPTDGER